MPVLHQEALKQHSLKGTWDLDGYRWLIDSSLLFLKFGFDRESRCRFWLPWDSRIEDRKPGYSFRHRIGRKSDEEAILQEI